MEQKQAPAKPLSPGEAKKIAQGLRDAMKGFGTNEQALIDLLTPLKAAQIEQVVLSYTKDIGRDLEKDIKSEVSGKFEDALVALITPAAVYDATLIKKAIAGIGTNDHLLIETVCTRDPVKIAAMKDAYRQKFGKDLVEEVKDDVSGDYGKLLVKLLTVKPAQNSKVEDDMIKLYTAGEGKVGTNEDAFIDVLAGNSRAYVAKLDQAYGNKYGKPLRKVIDSEMSGNLAKALTMLVTPPAEYFAEQLYLAMKGMGTDEATLIRIIVSQREHLQEICQTYIKKYEKSLSKAIEGDCGGDFKKTLVSLVKHHGEI